MRRLLILVPAFPKDDSTSYTVPFIQHFLLAFIKKYDVKLDILTLYIPTGRPYEWESFEVIPLNGALNDHVLKKGIFIFKAANRIVKMLRERSYDGILSFWYRETAMIGKLVSSRLKVTHYTWLQGQDVRRRNKYMHFSRPKPEQLIALSGYQNDILYQQFGLSANIVAPVAVNPSFFPPLNEYERPIDILGAGSLTPLKNHRLFLEVVYEIQKIRKNLKVVLIGNGPLEPEYKTFIKDHFLEGTVTLTGLLNHSETLKYMNNSKIFLHTSTFEGGGMVCLESLFSGCHLISTLPLIKSSNNRFSWLTDKQTIVNKVHLLLNKESGNVRRCIENPMDETCRIIYELFF